MALQHNIITFLLLVSLSPKMINCNSQYNDLQHDIMDAIDMHGYNEMTRSLNFALEVFYPATTNAGLTIFAPTNEGLLSLESPISREEHLISIKPPPMDSTLLQYHMVPLKLDANNLTLFSSTFPTLLYGHNLTVTTSPHDSYNNNNPSLNNVPIKEWNIYNDGTIVVHGVERFLDPNFHLINKNNTTTTTAAAETTYNKAEAASPGPSEDDYEDEAGYKILANYIIFFALLCLSVFIIDKFCSAYDD